MSASSDKLGELHALLAAIMIEELQWYRSQRDEEGGFLPVPASDKAAVAKFLKDNNVTSDPVDDDAIEELRQEFLNQSKARRTKAAEASGLAREDLEALYQSTH